MSQDALALLIALSFLFVPLIIVLLIFYISEKLDPINKFMDDFFLNSNPVLCYLYSPRLFKKKYYKARAKEAVSFCEKHGISIEEFSNRLETHGLDGTYSFFYQKMAEKQMAGARHD
jgi:hypothetical protein